MPNKLIRKAFIIAGLTLGASSVAFAAENTMTGADGQMLANTCAGCHGTDGVSDGPATPTIAGFDKEYFIEVMQGYASGDIKSTIMGRIAAGYSEEELEKMAEAFGANEFASATQDYDESAVKNGAKLHEHFCEKCHEDGGVSGEDGSPMAGQWTPYLKWTMQDFQAGDREAPKKMAKKMQQMHERYGNDAVHALLSYYASQQ